MIRGIHGLFYSSQADEARAFLRDKVRLPFSDVGQGWLIFDLPEGDLGVHPIDESGRPPLRRDRPLFAGGPRDVTGRR